MLRASSPDLNTSPDISQDKLDAVLEGYRPPLWLVDHFNRHMDGELGGHIMSLTCLLYGGACWPEGLPCVFWLSVAPSSDWNGRAEHCRVTRAERKDSLGSEIVMVKHQHELPMSEPRLQHTPLLSDTDSSMGDDAPS